MGHPVASSWLFVSVHVILFIILSIVHIESCYILCKQTSTSQPPRGAHSHGENCRHTLEPLVEAQTLDNQFYFTDQGGQALARFAPTDQNLGPNQVQLLNNYLLQQQQQQQQKQQQQQLFAFQPEFATTRPTLPTIANQIHGSFYATLPEIDQQLHPLYQSERHNENNVIQYTQSGQEPFEPESQLRDLQIMPIRNHFSANKQHRPLIDQSKQTTNIRATQPSPGWGSNHTQATTRWHETSPSKTNNWQLQAQQMQKIALKPHNEHQLSIRPEFNNDLSVANRGYQAKTTQLGQQRDLFTKQPFVGFQTATKTIEWNPIDHRQSIQINTNPSGATKLIQQPDSAHPTNTMSHSVNLSSLIEPGQILLAKKSINQEPKVSLAQPREIETLLRSLKPLAINDKEKLIESTNHLLGDSMKVQQNVDLNSDKEIIGHDQTSDTNNNDDVDGTDHDDSAEDLSDQQNSVGHEADNGKSSVPKINTNKTTRAGTEEEELAFIKSLAALSSKLASDSPPRDPDDGDGEHNSNSNEQFYESPKQLAHIGPSSMRDLYTGKGLADGKSVESDATTRTETFPRRTVPVEWLVDQLMSNSRKATFGLQHDHLADQSSHRPDIQAAQVADDNRQPADNFNGLNIGLTGQDEDEEEEEEEEEDEEDDDGGGGYDYDPGAEDTMPLGGSMETNESWPRQTRALPAHGLVSFNSVANNSNSWVPLAGLRQLEGQSSELQMDKSLVDGDRIVAARSHLRHKKKKKKRPKRKRKKKKKRRLRRNQYNNESSGLIIGNKKLSRDELIKLIGIVNKMAIKKVPSKERDASRRLLRLLMKLALDNYKSKQRLQKTPIGPGKGDQSRSTSGHENDDREPIKKSLRSLLTSPEFATTRVDNSTKISIKLQPWRAREFIKENELNEERRQRVTNRDHDFDRDNDHDREDTNNTEANDIIGQSSRGPSTRERKKSLIDISDDLDKYFDRDFFEDMADQMANKSNGSSRGLKKSSNERLPWKQYGSGERDGKQDDGERRITALSRSQLRYQPPIIIYNQKQLEEADEDDVELDHIRLAPRTFEANRRRKVDSKKQHRESGNRDRPQALASSRNRSKLDSKTNDRTKRVRKKAISATRDDDYKEDFDYKEDEHGQDDGESIAAKSKQDHRDKSGKGADRSLKSKRTRLSGPEDRGTSSNSSNDMEVGRSNGTDEGEEDEEDVEADEDDKQESEAADEGQASGKRFKKGKRPDRISSKVDSKSENKSRDRSQSRRRRRRRPMRRPVDGSSLRLNGTIAMPDEELVYRDEIPAPIVAGSRPIEVNEARGRFNVTGTTKISGPKSIVRDNNNNNNNSNNAIKKKKVEHLMIKAKSQNDTALAWDKKKVAKNSTRLSDAGLKKPHVSKVLLEKTSNNVISEQQSTGLVNKVPAGQLVGSVAKKRRPILIGDDLDYYNEGTTYSGSCDDEGKCNVTLQSSNPELGRAIKGEKRPVAIVKKLDKWIREEPT